MRIGRVWSVAVLSAVMLVGLASPTCAQAQFDPEAIGATAAGLVGLAVTLKLELTPPGEQVNWRGGIGADDGARDLFRLRSASDRAIAQRTSDILLGGTLTMAGLLDSIVTPLVQGDTDFASYAGASFTVSLAITMVLGDIVKRIVRRARPWAQACTGDDCEGDAGASFYSLHSAVAFTAAGHSCALHLSRSLYGDRLADATACVGSLVAASATSLLRVAADVHYLSDVFVGAALGFVTGYLVAFLLVPPRGRHAAPDAAAAPTVSVIPSYAPEPSGFGQIGVQAVGLW